MTLATSSNRVDYTGNGSTNLYPFTFPVFESSDLLVVVTDTIDNETTLVLNTDYSVSGLNPAGGPASTGDITLINAGQAWLTSGNLTLDFTISILREVPVEQNTSIRNQGDFFPETIENALDYLTMIDQQINELLDRAVTLPVGISPSQFDPTLPENILNGAGMVLVVNDDADGWALGASTTGLITIPVPISQGGTNSTTALVNGKFMVSSGGKIVEGSTGPGPSGGIVVTTPDGLHTYELGVDNNGEFTTTQLT